MSTVKMLCAAMMVMLPATMIGAPAQAAPRQGQLVVVQAVPDLAVGVSVDGKSVSESSASGEVLGPFDLGAGEHVVRFLSSAGEVILASRLDVVAGKSKDIVLHRPAAVGGDPVVNVYSTPTATIDPGKARVVVAHTATVPPADVRVDGQTVFTNIANGEFAVAEVPAGSHRVALLPTGQTTGPLLGPIDVTLKAQSVTMVYAIGNPGNDSMDLISSTRQLKTSGMTSPRRIDTGSAGLAGQMAVTPFGPSSATPMWAWSVPLGLVAALMLMVGRQTARRRRAVPVRVDERRRDESRR